MNRKAATYVENVFESGCACLLTMVQGNALALTLSHWLTASETGLLSGAVASTAILVGRVRRPWMVSLTLGVITAAADFIVHPGAFGVAEAVVTGMVAAVLSFAVTALVRGLPWKRRLGYDL